MRKTVHILGGGQWQLPTIRKAKERGYRIVVTDIYESRPGYALADVHQQLDIADREATLEVARRHHIDGIICDTTDVGVPTMAYVAEKLGLPGIGLDVALNFTRKDRMRRLVSGAGLPSPDFEVVTDVASAIDAARVIGFPLVVKPVDNQSSRGVHIVRRIEDLSNDVEDALLQSRAKAVIVESFVEGIEVTVESFVCESKVFVAGISDKDHFAQRPEVANRLTYPPDLPERLVSLLVSRNEKILSVLGLRTGIAHAEYIVTETDAVLLEVAARGAGSYVYSDIVPYLVGADVPGAYLDFVVSGSMKVDRAGGTRAANLAFLDIAPGRVTSIHGVEAARELAGVRRILLEFGVGDQIYTPEDDRSRPGLILAFGASRQEVLATTARAMSMIRVDTE
jgi:biotin carboxylase